MKIALFVNLPPGGAKRSAHGFGRYLAARHEVDLYQLQAAGPQPFDLAGDVRRVFEYQYRPFMGVLNDRLERGQYAPRSLTLFGPLRRLHRQIARDIGSRGYDVVLAHTDRMTQSPYLLRWLSGVPNVYYCHEALRAGREQAILADHRRRLGSSPPPLGTLRVIEDVWVMRRWIAADLKTVAAAGKIAVNSRHTREQVRAAYGRDSTVCYPGIDAQAFSPGKSADRSKEILSVGTPVSIKGHDLVIQALALIPQPMRPALRVVASSSEGADALETLARSSEVALTLDRNVHEAALVERYRRALATVCAARLEPLGLTALESMACGTPVVAIKEGGFLETVRHGETGLLVEPAAGALAEGVSQLAANPGLVESMGLRGRECVTRDWTWEHAGERLETMLREAARQ
jgi:glycosyltransferase involved in cell wall biosynthesis